MGKVLGIIGGMGPLATVKFFENIVLLTEAKSDQEHIHILIDNNTSIPDRTAFILDNKLENPIKKLIISAQRLEKMGSDYLVMPCNTAHEFYGEIVKNINIPFLNMIEESAKFIENKFPHIKKVGLLATEGTIKAKIYNDIFKAHGIQIIEPSLENQEQITKLIYNIKKDILQNNLDGYYETIEEFREQDISFFLAGCTEISTAISLYNLTDNIIDPMKILALKAIEFAGKKAKYM